MIKLLARSLVYLSIGVFVAGCKLAVLVVEGGHVESQSGAMNCAEGRNCLVEINASDFSDTFTAISREGYRFSRWYDGAYFLCGGSTNPTCVIDNSGTADDAGMQAIIASNATFYIMPVFEFVGIDTDGDGIPDHIDEDDDNDGIPDEYDPDPLFPGPPTPRCPPPVNAEVLSPVNASNPTIPTRIINLGQGNIVSEPFIASDSLAYAGSWQYAALPDSIEVRRRMWVSICPGEESQALTQGSRCFAEANEAGVIRLSNDPSQSLAACILTPGESYFLNLQNLNCGNSQCRVYRNIYSNGL